MAAAVLADFRVVVVAFDEDLSGRAMEGWRRFGKRRAPVAPNVVDCCTYALAEQTGYPILCVGDDFARTYLPVHRPPEP